MHRIRKIFAGGAAFAAAVTAFVTLATLTSVAASAQVAPAPPGDPVPTSTGPIRMISHGSPIWTFVVVGALTAVVTVAITLLVVQRVHRMPRSLTTA
ncbi:hypothetical protein ACSMXN_24440 [Jatrophihabitans sp. DSM 45814]